MISLQRKALSRLLLAATLAAGLGARLAQADQTWTYTYNSNGQVTSADGPRTDVSDVTQYTYDSSGNLATVTNALGQVTTLSSYNALGLPGKVLDPNGVVTLLTYNGRGQVLTRTVQAAAGNATTTFTYNANGLLTKMALPSGKTLTYTYDAAHRLTQVQDNLGNQIDYSLDAMGDVTQTQVKDSGGNLMRTQSRVFDELGRLIKSIDALGHTTTYQYDVNGNETGSTDANGNATSRAFDALNRLISDTDAANGTTQYSYDAEDNLTGVTDPRGLTTSYSYDYAGNRTAETSPDTGTTTYTYDAAGNVTQATDARGVVTQYSYDALNRLTKVHYPANSSEDVTYTYDQTANGSDGIGRLTTVTDSTGSTQYTYDALGDITSVTSTIENQAATTQYRYDLAGRLTGMTYPSGRIVSYTRDSQDRVQQITTQANSSASVQTVISQVQYLPFGPTASFQYGNGLTRQLSHNQNYQLTAQTSSVLQRSYQYDPVGDITAITDGLNSTQDQSFQYDPLLRLTQATGVYGTLNYTYDSDGNRLSRDWVQGSDDLTDSYSYASDSNRLMSVGINDNGTSSTRTLSYDADGNLIKDQRPDRTLSFIYNQANRLQEVDQSSQTQALYQYNALGQRVIKVASNPAANRHFTYDLAGHLLAETTPDGTLLHEYIYLNDEPVAMLATDASRPPVVTATPSSATSATAGSTYQYQVQATDPGNTSLTYSLTQAPSGMSIDSSTGLITWTPDSTDVGTANLTITVTDAYDNQTQQTVQITVNPAATPTAKVVTVDTNPNSSADFHSLEAAVQANEGTLAQPLIIKASASSGVPDTTPVDITGYVTTAQNNVTIQLESGYMLDVTAPKDYFSAILIQIQDLALEGKGGKVVVHNAGHGYVNGVEFSNLKTGAQEVGENLIIRGVRTGDPGSFMGLHAADPDATYVLRNNLITGFEGAAQCYGLFVTGLAYVDNNTLVGNLGGLRNASNQSHVYNNLAYHNTGGDYTAWGGSWTDTGHNFSGDSTSPDAGYRDRIVRFVDTTQGDYRPLDSASDVINQAADLSSDPNYPFDTDALGQTRTNWDIGAFNAATFDKPNRAPILDSVTTPTLTQGNYYGQYLPAGDPDGDTLTFKLTQGPAGLTIDPATGLVQWFPATNQVGTQTVSYAVTDSNGAQTQGSFNLSVKSYTGSTTPRVVTVDTDPNSSADYHSLEAAVKANEGTLTQPLLIKATASTGIVDTTPVKVSSYVTTPHDNLTVQLDPSYTLDVTGAKTYVAALRVEIQDFSLVGHGHIVIHNSGYNYDVGVEFQSLKPGALEFVDGVVINGDSINNPGSFVGLEGTESEGTYVFRNNLVSGFHAHYQHFGIRVAGRGYIDNNTLIDNGTGLDYVSTQGRATNNLALGNTHTDYSVGPAGWTTTGHNLSGDATSPDTAYRNQSVQFENASSGDYHLATTDTAALGQGLDQSQSTVFPFSTDADAQVRTTPWSIGAYNANTTAQ